MVERTMLNKRKLSWPEAQRMLPVHRAGVPTIHSNEPVPCITQGWEASEVLFKRNAKHLARLLSPFGDKHRIFSHLCHQHRKLCNRKQHCAWKHTFKTAVSRPQQPMRIQLKGKKGRLLRSQKQ